jgi:acyl-CoA hydrolase
MKPRSPEASRTLKYELVLPPHTNAQGTAFGGTIMSWIDIAGAIACQRHSLGEVVTASMDRIDFVAPVRLGDILRIEALVTCVGDTSMEAGVTVAVENDETGAQTRAAQAFVTFVAVDDDGNPRDVPTLKLETDEQEQRFNDGLERKRERLAKLEESRKIDIGEGPQ